MDFKLKDIYKDYFKIGVACERINGRFTNHEIGNPAKEALMAEQFNSMTCANELKPMYNMGFNSPDATEEFLPFVPNENAVAMLSFARDNGLKVRGHVMVWHSQCPREIFAKGYNAVTIPTDPEKLKENPYLKFFEKLNPECYVSREVLLKRIKSYIYNLVKWTYESGFAQIIYAWDVVNEAIELADKTETGVRKSYWSEIIGPDYIYWAFRFARDAVDEISAGYDYGKPLLFYNDYNEFDPEKKKAIIANLGRSTAEHGSAFSEHLIDGIGMQGHLSDTNDIDLYYQAIMDYSALVDEVHITELDVKCTSSGVNAFYYQADFYKRLFEAILKANKNGGKVTSVTVWGLTDDNSWIRGANPLLFNGDLSPKLACTALKYAVTGESLGEPEPVVLDLSDRFYDFEPVSGTKFDYAAVGFKNRGLFPIDLLKEGDGHSGNHCLALETRFDGWSGILLDVSDFIGQTVKIGAWVKSPAKKVTLNVEHPNAPDKAESFAAVDSSADEWRYLEGECTLPSDCHSVKVYFYTEEASEGTFSPIYVDDVSLHLIGLKESFEGDTNIAAIRGMGHLPFLSVTDTEAVTPGTRSLRVSRQEKDATVKFDVSTYIGRDINISLYVKTADTTIRVGIDGCDPLGEFTSAAGSWTHITVPASVPDGLRAAALFVETSGSADIFIDDLFITLA